MCAQRPARGAAVLEDQSCRWRKVSGPEFQRYVTVSSCGRRPRAPRTYCGTNVGVALCEYCAAQARAGFVSLRKVSRAWQTVATFCGCSSLHCTLNQRRFCTIRTPRLAQPYALRLERLEVGRDVRDRLVPADRLVFIGCRVVAHRMGQPAAFFEGVVGPAPQCRDGMFGEKFRAASTARHFPCRSLGAFLTKLEGMRLGGLGPGACWSATPKKKPARGLPPLTPG